MALCSMREILYKAEKEAYGNGNILIAGAITVDIIAANLPYISEPGKVVRVPEGIKTLPGGHAFNVAVNLTKLGVSGRSIQMIAAAGRDGWDNYIRQKAGNYNIKADLFVVNSETSKNLILGVKGEDRRYHVDIGANQELSPKRIKEAIQTGKPRIFYIGPTGILGRTDKLLREILEIARDVGSLIVVDITFPYQKDWRYLLPCLSMINILHAGVTECFSLTGETDPVRIPGILSERGVKLPLITDGKNGLLTNFGGKDFSMGCFNVQEVDTSGAGDAFCAGFIYAISREMKAQGNSQELFLKNLGLKELKYYFNFASATAAASIGSVGTTTGVSLEKVNMILKTQGILELRDVCK